MVVPGRVETRVFVRFSQREFAQEMIQSSGYDLEIALGVVSAKVEPLQLSGQRCVETSSDVINYLGTPFSQLSNLFNKLRG